jgi:putative ABC transport system permease protein
MNLFQLVFKQMRQRALSTWLTLFSILLGVALAVAIGILQREGGDLFTQKNFGYEIIVGPPKGSPTQLVLNTVYQIDQSAGNLPYSVYEDLLKNRMDVKHAIPIAVGDNYKGHRIIGTSPKLFGLNEDGTPSSEPFEYQNGKSYTIPQGRVFSASKFEAVIGSDVPMRTGLKISDKFKATHGLSTDSLNADEHDTQWTVVGVLGKTNTAADRGIYIPLISFFAIQEHGDALHQQAEMKAALGGAAAASKPAVPTAPAATEPHDEHDHLFHVEEDGTIELHLPKNEWVVSAVLVKGRGDIGVFRLIHRYKVIDPSAIAVNPATVMRDFFDAFFKNVSNVLLLISILVIIVATIGVLVSIYNSVSARMREIAILRALGATRHKILMLICIEAGLIGFFAALAGTLAGHLLAAIGSAYLYKVIGTTISWLRFDWREPLFIVGVVATAVLAGLVPAMKAYRTPVATNLVAG